MTRRRPRWFDVVITAAAAVLVLGIGIRAMAAQPAAAPTNYHGPARPAADPRTQPSSPTNNRAEEPGDQSQGPPPAPQSNNRVLRGQS